MRIRLLAVLALLGLVAVGVTAFTASASHSWGKYHWGTTAKPFTLQVGDNVGSAWDQYLNEAISDWNPSSVLDLTKVAGSAGSSCQPRSGRIEVCNGAYGTTGWLGIAQIWIVRQSKGQSHIYQAITKVNDTYFNQAQYNTPAWRRLVMCQEIAHDFGLDHQDEGFGPPNLGTCMDYTNDPDGGGAYGPSNEHPNAHDFAQIESIYSHVDSTSTVGAGASTPGNSAEAPGHDEEHFEKSTRLHHDLYVRHLPNGVDKYTHVFWAP